MGFSIMKRLLVAFLMIAASQTYAYDEQYRPDGLGGYARPDGLGGYYGPNRYHTSPDGLGGWSDNRGGYSRPDGLGGWYRR